MLLKIQIDFLAWMTIINAGLFLVSVLAYLFFKKPLSKMAVKMYGITTEQFKELYMRTLAFYKILILMFNVIPWIALCIIMN